MAINVRQVYANLKHIDEVDSVTGAQYRQSAQEVLSESSISLARRMVIADRLMEANHFLGMQTTTNGDSY
ncbi:MAG: hypothetical protein LH647_10840 [Leptolyngbyaceae cyanobacterium CAN_BIN12]|nr:hypothetical protein [Leptolyngbyaceae cyanobacterium CAN_BIN12]